MQQAEARTVTRRRSVDTTAATTDITDKFDNTAQEGENLETLAGKDNGFSPGAMNGSNTKPLDFEEALDTDDDIPLPETLRKINKHEVLDGMGARHTFWSLHSGCEAAQRILVIFVRHFYCGACEQYLRSLSASIRAEPLPASTGVVVVGCGDHRLIASYAKLTSWPFPIYTDPSRLLYSELGMVKSLRLGAKPEYISKNVLEFLTDRCVKALTTPPQLALKSGPLRQAGGEFLFDRAAPSAATRSEQDRHAGASSLAGAGQRGARDSHADAEAPAGDKRVVWCHRMRTMRDYTEIAPIRKLLRGMHGVGDLAVTALNGSGHSEHSDVETWQGGAF